MIEPNLDYLYWEPFIESWIVSFYINDEKHMVMVRHTSDSGQTIKKAIRELGDYLKATHKITRICHSCGKRFSVWLDNEEHINASNMPLFVDYALQIAKEANKELISQSPAQI